MCRLALLGSLIAQLLAAPCPPPSLSESSLALWSENVATFSDGSPRGYGLVVGWQTGRAWIAVPAHVAFGADQVQKPLPATMQIRLAGDVNPRNLCPNNGELVNPRPPKFGVDLTFVCVMWDARPYFWTGLAAASTRVNDLVALIPTSTQLRGLVTRASSPEGTNANDFVEAGMAGEPSLSGAPVGSPRGVVGLYLGIGANDARARARVLPIWQIRSQADESEVPWQLTDHEYFDCGRTRQVCVQVASTVKPERVSFREVASNTSANVAVGKCVALPEGRYALDYEPRDVSCEPAVISIFAATNPLVPAIKCVPNLTGEWLAENGDQLMCSQAGAGQATCVGLARLGLGIFQGTLTESDSRFTVTGYFVDGAGNSAQATGQLTWTSGRLVGQIQRSGYGSQSLNLTRR